VFLQDIPSGTNLTVYRASRPIPEVSDGTNTVNWNGDVIDNVGKFSAANAIIYNNSHPNGIISFYGRDYISAGPGDVIRVDDGAGDDTVACTGENITVYFDPGDTVWARCDNQHQVG
jgi:hypothetical protein